MKSCSEPKLAKRTLSRCRHLRNPADADHTQIPKENKRSFRAQHAYRESPCAYPIYTPHTKTENGSGSFARAAAAAHGFLPPGPGSGGEDLDAGAVVGEGRHRVRVVRCSYSHRRGHARRGLRTRIRRAGGHPLVKGLHSSQWRLPPPPSPLFSIAALFLPFHWLPPFFRPSLKELVHFPLPFPPASPLTAACACPSPPHCLLPVGARSIPMCLQ